MNIKKEKKNTEIVRVSASTHAKVKKRIGVTKQSIGGFFDLAAQEKLNKKND